VRSGRCDGEAGRGCIGPPTRRPAATADRSARSASLVRYRRAMMILASVGGNRLPAIAQLPRVAAHCTQAVIAPRAFQSLGVGPCPPAGRRRHPGGPLLRGTRPSPMTGSPRAISRPAATALSHRPPIHSTCRVSSTFFHLCWTPHRGGSIDDDPCTVSTRRPPRIVRSTR
jgi:hypothetical protein